MALMFSVATPEQAESIVFLVNSAYRGDHSRLGWTTEADLLGGQRIDTEMIREMIANPNEVILIAYDPEDEHKMVGCVDLVKISDEVCYLGMLTVKPTLQNKSFGRKILSEAESFARGWGCQKIHMTVIAQRRELIDWYCRRGYTVTNERKPFPYGDARFGIPERQDLFFIVLAKSL